MRQWHRRFLPVLVAGLIAPAGWGCRVVNPPPKPVAADARGASVDHMTAKPGEVKVADYLKPETFDFKAIMGDPPADDSDAHRAEVDRLLSLQDQRTPFDVARCKAEEEVTVFAFANVLGPWFTKNDLPITTALMDDVYAQTKVVSGAAKKGWNRVRPPLADSRIHPCVELEKSASYPSGHATRGVVWAVLLAEMFPEDREILMARGREIGSDRTLAGMHWPSDIEAGQKLGAEVARRFLADPQFRQRLAAAREECMAVLSK